MMMSFAMIVYVPALVALGPLLSVPVFGQTAPKAEPQNVVFKMQAEPEKLVAKALAATGWDKKKSEHSTWKDKGKFEFGGEKLDFTGEYHLTAPDKYRWKMSMKFNNADVDLTVVINGDKGWEASGGKTVELTGNKLEYLQNELHQMNVLSLKPLLDPKQFTLKAIEDATVDGKKCPGLAAEKTGKPTVKVWFDATTGLPVKLECKIKNEFDNWKDGTDELLIGDWADDDGVKNFKSMKIVRNGKPMIDSTCSDFKQPEKVDLKLYEKP